ncbi:glycosyltransferase family 4 protein [Candidatus Bathyarchaeota archaeon]|nr:glycosyltransferase family 4 protein [Candidatus Bathyarchaeota archaeon]
MKVALISHEGGGISSVAHGLAQSLAKKKIETAIFTGTLARNCHTEKVNDYLEIVRLPILDFPPRSFWFQILNIRKLSKLLKDYTVIHGVSPDASFMFTSYKKKLEKPLIATIHGSPRAIQKVFVNSPISSWNLGDFGYNIIEFPLHEFTISRILSKSDHVVVCSFTTLEELKTYKALDLKKTSVIYNGVNFDEIEKTKQLPNNNTNDLTIVFAGRLFWTKGIAYLLKAFQIIRQNFRNVHLKIFGKGPLEQRVRSFITEADLNSCVSFHGHIPHRNLIAEVKTADIVVLPSLYEAQPIFALEAMACKKPLVVFNVPYAREIISDRKTGLLAKVHDVNDLSNKIQTLISDKNLRERMGEDAYNYVRRKHDWNVLVKSYLRVYRETEQHSKN